CSVALLLLPALLPLLTPGSATFCLPAHVHPRSLPSFPTRRSSDLPVQVPGSGLVAFASLSFGSHAQDSDDPNAGLGHSRLVVPEVVFGRRNGTSWVTVIGSGLQTLPDAEPAPAPAPVESAEFSDGSIEQSRWPDVVAEAIKRIESGALDKVVLARDVIARFAEPRVVRLPLHRLS